MQGQTAQRPIRVEIPNLGIVEFPAGTSEDQMTAAIQQTIKERQSSQPQPGLGSAVKNVAGGALEILNPLNMVTGAAQAIAHPIDTAKNIVAPLARLANVPQAYRTGGLTGAANEIAASVPLIGPAAEQASQLTKSSDPAERQRGYGQVIGQIIAAPVTEGAIGAAKGMTAAAVNRTAKAFANPNATEAAALQYAASKGVPVDAGTMSGNAFLKGTKKVTDNTIGGSMVAQKASQQEAKGLATIADQLAAKAHASAATPESAGAAVSSALDQRIKDLHAVAGQEYGKLRQIEAANVQNVVMGTGTSPSGLVKNVSITQPVGLPVNLQAVKKSLRPLYDRMLKQMPETQAKASKGLKTLENIIHGPDVVAASVADADLSTLKAIVRGADSPELRDVSQGLAASAVAPMEQAVKDAVKRGGPDAEKALKAGRAATKAKYATAELADKLREEPVQAYRQATAAKDTGINMLRDLAREAPAEMPKIGRAFLDDMIGRATGEGGFKGAAKMAGDWEKLGPETKRLIFTTPGLVSELDKFFLAAKKLAENPNPSGTAGVNAIGAQYGAAAYSGLAALTGNPLPLVGLGALQLTSAGLAKALRSPSTIRILTQGMTAKPASATAALARQTVMRLNQPEKDQP